MSAPEVARRFCEAVADRDDSLCGVNFANPDMVGHTGSIPAAIAAVETVDRCSQTCWRRCEARGGVCLVTADHGNAETMLTPEGKPHTAHTTNPVPLVVTLPDNTDTHPALRDGGRLGDGAAPTVLQLLGLELPAEMTGSSLVVGATVPVAR